MRTTLVLALAAVAAMTALPPGEAQGPDALYRSTSADDWGAWTATEDEASAVGQAWHASAVASDDDGAGVFGGWVDPTSDEEAGYFSAAFGATVLLLEAPIYLESPVIDATGETVAAIVFSLRGSAEPGFDPFEFQVDTGTGYQTAFTTDGVGRHGTFSTITLPAAALGVSGKEFRLRLVFTPDGSCDTYDAVCGGDWEGWYVDNVRVLRAGGATVTTTTTTTSTTAAPVGPLIVAFPATAQSVSGVNMLTQGGRELCIHVAESNFNAGSPWNAVTASFVASGTTHYELALQRSNPGTDWSTCFIPNASPLNLGLYSLRITSYASPGTLVAQRNFQVQGTDDGPPQIFFVGGNADKLISENDGVTIVPVDRFLRIVAYQTSSMPVAQEIGSPYVLSANAFLEGPQQLTVYARDRAGNAAQESIQVTKDSTAPNVTVTLPNGAYAGLDIVVDVTLDDASATKVFLVIGDDVQAARLDAGGGSVDFTLRRPMPQDVSARVIALDTVGHWTTQLLEIPVVEVSTDMVLDSITPGTGPYLAGETVPLAVRAHQADGVTAIPVVVQVVSDLGPRQSTELSVPTTGDAQTTMQLVLPPGQHLITVSLQTNESIDERDPTNQQKTAIVEVFAGRLTVDGKEYHIRVSRFALPLAAIDLDAGKSYPLVGGTGDGLYRFIVDGVEYEWDPLDPIAEHRHDEEDTPMVLLPFGLALVAVAAWRRRRP